MNSADQYRVERMSAEKFGDLELLYKDAFMTDITEDFLKQKYDTGFTGKKFIGFIAYDEKNNPAAYYGVFPLFAEYKGETILAAQSGDTMTHPAHRGKGLFIRLAAEAYRLASDEGINFVYGFPNKHNSYHGLMKLKWTHNGYMNKYRIIVPAMPLSLASAKVGALKKTYLKLAEAVLSKHESGSSYFENSIPQDEFIRIKHDTEYFSYKKYFKKYLATVSGKNVYLKADNTLQVGDIERCTYQEYEHVISDLKLIAFKMGVPVITFQVTPGTEQEGFLAKRYKAGESLPICFLNLKSELDLTKLKFTQADFDTF
jgi:GNAT superfamily N-acetyltransferase